MEKPIACVIGSLSIVRPLGRAGISVVAATRQPSEERLGLSRYVVRTLPLPKATVDARGAVDGLLAFAATLPAPPVLFFDDDEDLLLISRHRDELSTRYRFTLPSPELLEDLVDKRRFAALALRAGLPVPETVIVSRGATQALHGWKRFPCIVKPGLRTRWFGSKLNGQIVGATQKAIRVASAAELEALLPELEAHGADFIVQPLIEGGEERIVSYHAYVRDGVVIADFTGRKIRTAPREYGFSTCVQITEDPLVRRVGRDVVERVGFSGVIKLDFKEDHRTSALYLLEANPRFNLWHHPGAVAGVNLPLLVYRDLTEPGSVQPGQVRARSGIKWMSAAMDLSAFPAHHAAGELSRLQWLRDVVTSDVIEDLCWSDPLPGAARLLGRIRQRAARAFSLRQPIEVPS